MSLEWIPAGTAVFRQGAYGDKYYIILQGSCVVKITKDIEPAAESAAALNAALSDAQARWRAVSSYVRATFATGPGRGGDDFVNDLTAEVGRCRLTLSNLC
jgi:hypothetical protein